MSLKIKTTTPGSRFLLLNFPGQSGWGVWGATSRRAIRQIWGLAGFTHPFAEEIFFFSRCILFFTEVRSESASECLLKNRSQYNFLIRQRFIQRHLWITQHKSNLATSQSRSLNPDSLYFRPKRYCPVLVAQEGSALWGNTLTTALLHDLNRTIPFGTIVHVIVFWSPALRYKLIRL